MKTKYIRTENDEIIVFSELQQHKEFKHFNPVSAGFISFGVDKDKNISCDCYGESVSLNLESDPEFDTKLAKKQILGHYY